MSAVPANASGSQDQTEDELSSSSTKANEATIRRREQVRRAQRTHRERRARYVQGLEAEVAHLRSKDARATTQLMRTNIINQRLRSLLRNNSIAIPPDIELMDDVPESTSFTITGTAGGSQRLNASSSASKVPTPLASEGLLDVADPQTAIDFVLALEQPCLVDHHSHHGHDGEVGHSMQLQSTALVGGPPIVEGSAGEVAFQNDFTWKIPRAQLEEQLDRLLASSMELSLTDEITPVMCWTRVKKRCELNGITHIKLDGLQNDLAAEVVCYGFGAIIDTDQFYAIFDANLPQS